MVGPLDHCPEHWRRKCYPRKCPPPTKPQSNDPPSTHNVLYLVDEHDVINGQKADRNAIPLRRHVWHHSVANLSTFNIGEEPDTINLHESIANPQVNKQFRWHGYIFGGLTSLPIPSSCCDDQALTPSFTTRRPRRQSDMPGSNCCWRSQRIRHLSLGPRYCNNSVPIGLVTPVRKDDKYRLLHSISDGKQKLEWHCAYYISKDVPKKSSGFDGFLKAAQDEGNPDQAPANAQDADTVAYNALMDDTAEDDVKVSDDGDSWGGNLFGFTIDDKVEAKQVADDEDPALKPYSGDALDEIEANSKAEEGH